MSDTSETETSQPDETMDRVLDEFNANHGVKVERVSRNGCEERQEVIKVYGTREDRYQGFDGEEVTNKRKVKIAEFPSSVAFEVLVGLAEAHGYRLEGK